MKLQVYFVMRRRLRLQLSESLSDLYLFFIAIFSLGFVIRVRLREAISSPRHARLFRFGKLANASRRMKATVERNFFGCKSTLREFGDARRRCIARQRVARREQYAAAKCVLCANLKRKN